MALEWRGATCGKCQRRINITFEVPPETWRAVVMNRWKSVCPTCFDMLAQEASIRYQFGHLTAQAWCDFTPRKRRR